MDHEIPLRNRGGWPRRTESCFRAYQTFIVQLVIKLPWAWDMPVVWRSSSRLCSTWR